jgi:DNA-binding protein YbaB
MIVPELIPILYDNIKSIEYTEESGSIVSVTVTGHDNHKFVQVKPSAFKSQSEMEDLLKTTEEQIGKTIASVVKNTFNRYVEEDITR